MGEMCYFVIFLEDFIWLFHFSRSLSLSLSLFQRTNISPMTS